MQSLLEITEAHQDTLEALAKRLTAVENRVRELESNPRVPRVPNGPDAVEQKIRADEVKCGDYLLGLGRVQSYSEWPDSQGRKRVTLHSEGNDWKVSVHPLHPVVVVRDLESNPRVPSGPDGGSDPRVPNGPDAEGEGAPSTIAMRFALELIRDTDPVDAALDPDRARRVAREALKNIPRTAN